MRASSILSLAALALSADAFSPPGAVARFRAPCSRGHVQMGLFGGGAPAPPASGTVALSFNGKTINVAPGSPLAEAAIKAKIRVRYDCTKGKCGMCEVKVNGKAMRTCVSKVPAAGGEVIVPGGDGAFKSFKA